MAEGRAGRETRVGCDGGRIVGEFVRIESNLEEDGFSDPEDGNAAPEGCGPSSRGTPPRNAKFKVQVVRTDGEPSARRLDDYLAEIGSGAGRPPPGTDPSVELSDILKVTGRPTELLRPSDPITAM